MLRQSFHVVLHRSLQGKTVDTRAHHYRKSVTCVDDRENRNTKQNN